MTKPLAPNPTGGTASTTVSTTGLAGNVLTVSSGDMYIDTTWGGMAYDKTTLEHIGDDIIKRNVDEQVREELDANWDLAKDMRDINDEIVMTLECILFAKNPNLKKRIDKFNDHVREEIVLKKLSKD